MTLDMVWLFSWSHDGGQALLTLLSDHRMLPLELLYAFVITRLRNHSRFAHCKCIWYNSKPDVH